MLLEKGEIKKEIMKITSIDVIEVTTARATVKGVPWFPVIARINTDEGISGFGEVGLAYGNSQKAAFGILRDFAPLVVGMDPFDTERIWQNLLTKTFWGQGGGGVIFGGISAIDTALWDIKGKALNLPVYKLLGGKTRDKLRAYASQIQFDWGKESNPLCKPEEYAEAALKAKEEGYDCVKVDPVGFNLNKQWVSTHEDWVLSGVLTQDKVRLAYERVKAIREACGPDMDIIIELHCFTDTNTAIQLGRILADLNCFYFEEPTAPLNTKLFTEIAREVKIPIASGERIYTRWGYRPFFEERSIHVIQPDLGTCGGIGEGKKICDMAHIYDIGVQIHVCGSPIATAAALHVETAIPNFVIHEHHAAALLEDNINTCKYDYQPKEGCFKVPELPGIGQELSDHAIKNANIIAN